MAVTVDWPAKVIHVPQADLTPLGGTLYELDTDWLRLQLKALEDDEEGAVWPDTHRHNTEVTIAGITYARFFEIINGYTLQFDPAGAYTVRLVGTNNNVFDPAVLVLNGVSVIGTNSAGLVTFGLEAEAIAEAVWDDLHPHATPGSKGAELTDAANQTDPAVIADAVWDDTDGHTLPGSTGELLSLASSGSDPAAIAAAVMASSVEPTATLVEALRLILAAQAGKLSGAAGTSIAIRDLGDTKDRIVATVDADGNRLSVATDAT